MAKLKRYQIRRDLHEYHTVIAENASEAVTTLLLKPDTTTKGKSRILNVWDIPEKKAAAEGPAKEKKSAKKTKSKKEKTEKTS